MTDPNAAVAPGWYSLPDGRLGYWDGTGWAAVSDAPPPAVASAPPTTEPTPETAAITADAPADVAPVLEPDAEPASAEPADPVADERAVVAEPAVVVDPVAPVPVLEPTVIDDATPPVVAAAVAFDPDAPPTGPSNIAIKTAIGIIRTGRALPISGKNRGSDWAMEAISSIRPYAVHLR